MLRLALTAGLTILALAAPAAADGDPDAHREARAAHDQAGYRRVRAGDVAVRGPVTRSVRSHHRSGLVRSRGGPVQPVSYGGTDGTVFHAWLPRNTNLPIYNIPPPYFPEP